MPASRAVLDVDDSPGSLAFRAVMLAAHFTAFSAILLGPALIAIPLRAPAWIVIPLGALCSTLTCIALLVDTQVYQLYRFHINAGVMNLLLGGAARETFEFSAVMYAQAAAAVALIVAASALSAWFWWRHVLRSPGRPRLAATVTAILLGATVSFHGVHIWADAVAREALLEQTDVLPLRYAATAKRQLRALGVDVRTHPVLTGSPKDGRSGLAYPLQPLRCQPAPTPTNIVVILIDSWRFDELNEQVTPNIHAFARRSARFMDHHSGGNATRIGVFSLTYSIPGTYWHRMLAERQGPVLLTQLLAHGYEVHAFRSAPLFSPEFDRTVFAQVDNVRMRSDGAGAAERDADLTHDFLSFLDTRAAQTPFFALLFYDSPHKLKFPEDYPLPFRPSSSAVNYLGLDNDTDPLHLRNRYRNSLHYVDTLIGQVLTQLQERSLLENSVVVVTGDHGQEFNDNRLNYWGHGSNFTKYQTAVPFLLYAPALPPGEHRHRTTHFDVVPTLLREYLACNEPFDSYSVGRSLFEPGGREAMLVSEYTDFAIVTADKIAVIRKHGMEVLDANHVAVPDQRIEPKFIEMTLEQRSRFYRRQAQPPASSADDQPPPSE